jgi:CIC family chloride channel protein
MRGQSKNNTMLDILKKFTRLAHTETAFSPGLDPMVPMLLVASAVGVISSLAVASFRGVMWWIVRTYSGEHHLVAAARALPVWARVAVPAIAGTLCGLGMWAGQRWIKRPRGPEYMEAVQVADGVLPLGPNLVRTGSSLLGVAGGITIGREGAMIQFAALASSTIGRIFRADESHRRLIVACGAAAGFASAYRAPIAGTLFVAEIILGGLALREISAVLVSAVISLLTTQALFESGPLYIAHAIPPMGFNDLFNVGLVGLAAGLFGPVFLWVLHATNKGYRSLITFTPLRLGLAGLAIGMLAVVRPEVWGNGVSVLQSFLSTHWALSSVVAVFLLRLVGVTYASAAGIPGGVLTPTLVTGAALGLIIGHTMLTPSADHSQTLWILVGAGSLLAATTHAPAMSAIMMFETTHNYQVALAALPACVIASVVGSLLRHQSIYTEALGLEEHGPAASAARRRTILPRATPFHLRAAAAKSAEETETRVA